MSLKYSPFDLKGLGDNLKNIVLISVMAYWNSTTVVPIFSQFFTDFHALVNMKCSNKNAAKHFRLI